MSLLYVQSKHALHILKDGDLSSCCRILTVVYTIVLSILFQKILT